MNKPNTISSTDKFQDILAQIENQFSNEITIDIMPENQIHVITKLEDYIYNLNKASHIDNQGTNFSQFNIGEIINLSERLYRQFLKVQRVGSPDLRKNYVRVLNVLDNFLNYAEENHFDQMADLPYSTFSYSKLRIVLRKGLSDLNKKLALANFSHEFIAVINNGINKLMYLKSITYSEVNNLRSTLDDLDSINLSQRHELLIYLIKRNFNPTELYEFCISLVDKILIDEPNLYQRIDHLITLQEEMLKTQIEQRLTQVKTRNTLIYHLKIYLNKKRDLLEKKMTNKIKQVKNLSAIKDTSKISLAISVNEFAFLIRLFMVENILPSENKGNLFEFFAHSFKTRTSLFISKDSLWKKSRAVEVTTASAVKDHLINMINYINKEYTANYFK